MEHPAISTKDGTCWTTIVKGVCITLMLVQGWNRVWCHRHELTITVINSWNRLNIATRTVPGAYQPAKAREMKRGAS